MDPPQTNKIYFTLHTISDGQNLGILGVYNTILHYGNRLYGKKVLIVNRSEIVGRPLAALLANDGATVYSVDINNIQQFTRGDDLLEQRHKVVDLSPEEYTLEKLAPQCDVIITGVPLKLQIPIRLGQSVLLLLTLPVPKISMMTLN